MKLFRPKTARVGPVQRSTLAFSHATRNLAIASSRVAAVPFVTPGVAGQIEVTDQNQRNSGAVPAEPSS